MITECTKDLYDSDPDFRTYIRAKDPGMEYILESGSKDRDRYPKPIHTRGFEPAQIPNQLVWGIWPEGTIEHAVHPNGYDLEGYALELIHRMGPIHFEDLYGELFSCVMGGTDDAAIPFLEYEDACQLCYRLVDEGKIISPDEDVILDVPSNTTELDIPPIKVVELFAGIGGFRKALTNLGIPHTSVVSEIDPWAWMSYNAIHGYTENLGDITKIEKLPECDVLTYGFPCQDISIAGKQRGFEEGSGTRSSLLWEVKRLLDAYNGHLPRILFMENVKNLVSKKNMPGFQKWLNHLESLGYRNTWHVINPPEVGIPQNRPRVFCISVLGDRSFEWPETPGIKCCLGDVRMNVSGDPSSNAEGIRRLTEIELFLLMGFTSRDAWRASRVCSDAQLQKQTGNSIVVQCVEHVFKGLLDQGFLDGSEPIDSDVVLSDNKHISKHAHGLITMEE